MRCLVAVAVLGSFGCAETDFPSASTPATATKRATGTAVTSDASSPPVPAIRGYRGEASVLTLEGRGARLADYGSDVTVVALWAPWCASCRAELPCFEELRRRYVDDRSVAFVAVAIADSAKDRDKITAAATNLGLSMPVVVDRNGEVMRRIGQPRRSNANGGVALPVVLVIDRNFVIDREMGWGYGSEDAYIASKQATIEAAKQGKMAARERTMDPETTSQPYDRIMVELSPEMRADLERAIPELRRQLKQKWTHLTESQLDGLMRRIEPAVRRGATPTVEIPGPKAP